MWCNSVDLETSARGTEKDISLCSCLHAKPVKQSTQSGSLSAAPIACVPHLLLAHVVRKDV